MLQGEPSKNFLIVSIDNIIFYYLDKTKIIS